MKKGQLVNMEWEDPIARAYRREEGNQFMRSYARMLTEDKNKIKGKSSLQLAEDIENFFKTEVRFRWGHVNSKDYGYFINPSISWMGLTQRDFDCWGCFVSSNEWTKRFGGEIDLEFLFYDKVEKLASQVFEVMSDTQKFEVLETLFKKTDLKPYLEPFSYFFVCLKAVKQTSPQVAEEFLCKIFDEFIESRDWCENLSQEEKEEVDKSLRNLIFVVLSPKETAHFFHGMLERNMDAPCKQEMVMKNFKSALSLMHRIDDKNSYAAIFDWRSLSLIDNGYTPKFDMQRNLNILEHKKYNRTLFEFFKYDNSQQMLAKISPILAETFASPYAISKRDGREIASFFKNVAMSLIDVGPTNRSENDFFDCSEYTIDLFKFLMDEGRVDALDAICSIENVEEIFPLFKLKGFIFQDYIENREKQQIEQLKMVETKKTSNKSTSNKNLKPNQEGRKL